MAILDDRIADVMSDVVEMLERKQSRTNEAGVRASALDGDDGAVELVQGWDEEDGKKEFPLWLHDGSDVTSLGQVAAMLCAPKHIAARYVLEEKGLPAVLYTEAKAYLTPTPHSDRMGIAIMLKPRAQDAQQLALDSMGGDEWQQLHITLAYYGKVGQTGASRDDYIALTRKLASEFGPFMVDLNGLTRFSVDLGNESGDPLVVNADAPQIELMRRRLLELSGQAGMKPVLNHGFSPHMTLGYMKPEDEMPLDRWVPRKVRIEAVWLGYGDSYILGSLQGANTMPPEGKSVYTGSPGPMMTRGFMSSTSSQVAHRAASMSRQARKKRKRKGRPDTMNDN